MALVKNAARNGAVCYHHDSKEIFALLCLFLPQGPTLYRVMNLSDNLSAQAEPHPSSTLNLIDCIILNILVAIGYRC